ncbi:MAG: cyclic nucleotide-binding domain-containing protein [Chromatiales bacterium]|nr:cyclic nucleotide-binding domain-containing protein [Chromatiales bacterium]
MAENKFKIAVVGSGPGGKSAAASAAKLGISHVLLEAEPHLSNTIYLYQKGKHVMAEPEVLPLRCPLGFEAGSREAILEVWNQGVQALGVNIRFNAEVKGIQGQKGAFTLTLANGESIEAEYVVLAIGLQGNIRKLGVEGEDLPFVQYQLNDPKEYQGENIVVVGAGDAAIENAVSLAEQNNVTIVNRRDEFARAKEGNLNAIMGAIDRGDMDCLYSTTVKMVQQVDPAGNGGKPGKIVLSTAEGETALSVDRIIGRLGAIPPRRFVESCGIKFPNDDPASVPAVSERYESNVPGLYIVGALAGYPLIKQAMNQGYEVVEYIEGRSVEPADEPLLKQKFSVIPNLRSVNEGLAMIQANVPLFSELTTLQLREFLLDSEILAPKQGDVVFALNDYTNTFFSILAGSVEVQVDPNDPTKVVSLPQGKFFGEMALIAGRRRTATVKAGPNCVLIETPRRSMNKLINSVESVKRGIDEAFLTRAIQQQIAPSVSPQDLNELVHSATIEQFAPGDVIFNEGDAGDSLHLVRVGSVTVSRTVAGKEVVLSYLSAGNYVGEMALLSDAPRSATVRATVRTETIRLDGQAFKSLLDRSPTLRKQLEDKYQVRLEKNVMMTSQPQSGDIISFLVRQGLGEATDVLLIDESICVRCDYCEKACAETHNGTSRLDREAGPTFAELHVPTSCRHCEHPHCMKDCPPDAIRRAENGEVFIAENCIGCGNCQRNCPYGVIQMAVVEPQRSNLWSWLLFGAGVEPGTKAKKAKPVDSNAKKAVKCDMCKDISGGPACVRACPTGAALRVRPEEFMNLKSVG